ncbi:MAG: putative signal transducing protein [Solirubrobacterales bacterium]
MEVAFVGSEPEAAMVQALLEDEGIRSLQQQIGPAGPMLGYGLLNPGGGSRRVMVHARQAEEARALLADVLAENENGATEPVNAGYLEDAAGGHKPRSYGLVGAYARIYLWSFAAMAVAFGVFTLLRAV